jgi:DNA-directed RNA polymerase specialized sigma subunit
MLQVSEPRVCQLHAEAVAKLRAMLSGEDEEEDDAA